VSIFSPEDGNGEHTVSIFSPEDGNSKTQNPGAKTQENNIIIITAVKASNLTC
jgi:hypothetical protein